MYSETVLLIEDDLDARDANTAVLEHLGYRVLTAATGEEALEQWRNHEAEIQVVLSDLVELRVLGFEKLQHRGVPTALPGRAGGRERPDLLLQLEEALLERPILPLELAKDLLFRLRPFVHGPPRS